MSTPHSLMQRTTKALKWSGLTELATRAAQPITFLVLARLLSPQDFGVVGVATIVISFTQMFWDAGLGKALVQTKIPLEKAANVVFWTNVALGVCIYILLFVGAGAIAGFFDSAASKTVLQVLGLRVIILALSSVHQALFIRDMNFRQLFWAKLSLALAPMFSAIPLALLGYGVWSLVFGSLTGATINLCVLWSISPWRPRFKFDWDAARRLFSFGIWVTAESLGVWCIAWGDQFLVGKYLNVEDLGLYQVACSVSMLVFALSLNPLLPLLYPAFSILQDDLPSLKKAFYKAIRVIAAIALPTGTGLLLTGSLISSVVFGEKWLGLGFVLGMLGLSSGIAWTVAANSEAYRAMGRPDVNTKFMYAQLLLYIPAYIISVRYGLRTFVCVKLSVCIVTIFFHILVCSKMLNVSPFYLWNTAKPVFLATLCMAGAVCLLKFVLATTAFSFNPGITLFALVSTGAVVYGSMLWLLDRPFVLEAKRMALKAISSQ